MRLLYAMETFATNNTTLDAIRNKKTAFEMNVCYGTPRLY